MRIGPYTKVLPALYCRLGSVIFLKNLKKMNTFIQQGCVKLIKGYGKDILLEKISILNMLFFLTFYSSSNPEKKVSQVPKK